MMLKRAMELVKKYDIRDEAVFAVSPSSVSRMTGQKRCNTEEFAKMGIRLRVVQRSGLGKYDVEWVPGKEEESAT